jgi:hypothetical protein
VIFGIGAAAGQRNCGIITRIPPTSIATLATEPNLNAGPHVQLRARLTYWHRESAPATWKLATYRVLLMYSSINVSILLNSLP